MREEMRRTPQQARAQQRVERIMYAAAELITEVGYEAATTNEIARRAETSIGSLYQFFPNKEAILAALVAKFSDGVQHLFDEVFVEPPLDVGFERMIDKLAYLYATDAGFRVVFYGFSSSPDFQGAGAGLYADVLARIEEALKRHIPHLDAERRPTCALLMLATVKNVLPYTLNADGTTNAVMVEELKRLLSGYVRGL